MGVVRRYIDFLIILLIPTPLVLALFAAGSLLLCSFKKCFFVLVFVILVQYNKRCSKNIRDRSKIETTQTWRYNQIDKNVCQLRAGVSPETSTCEVPRDVSRKLQLTLCAIVAS